MPVQRMNVLGEVAYAHSVRDFIIAILKRLIPGKCINGFLASSDEDFDANLNSRFAELDRVKAKDDAYRDEVLEVLGGEVAHLCEILRTVCTKRGYGAYYNAHISHKRFAWLVLHSDEERIVEMQKIVNDRRLTPIDVLRGVGAILNDETLEERAALDDKERRRANAEIKALAADVKTTMQLGFDRTEQKLIECRAEVKAIGLKVSKLKCRGKRRGKYDKASVQCLMIWERERADTTLRNTLNTRVTYEVVFERNKRELAELGIDSLAKFKKVIHAAQSKRSSDGIKALHSKQDEARGKPPRKMV